MAEKQLLDEDFVLEEMAYWKVPGLAIGAIHNGNVTLLRGYGKKNLADNAPVTPDTQFGIASCSKSFTSGLIAMLVDEGRLDYDTPVKEYMPGFEMYDPIATAQMTLRDMLCHRTGLPAHDALAFVDTISREELSRRLRYVQPNKPFRSVAQYNNLIYAMSGHVAERVTGRTWDDLIRERIFMPLGMTNSNTSVKDMVKAPDYATPYIDPGEGLPVREMAIWNVDLAGPAAAINTSARDMLKWLQLHIQNGVWEGAQLISERNMAEMHTPITQFDAWPWSFSEILPRTGYGMAWFIEQYRGNPLHWHTGEIEGYCSIEAVMPQARAGFVLLMNLHKPCIPIIKTLLYTMLDNVLGLPAVDWSARFHAAKGKFKAFYYHWDANLLPDPPVPGTSLSHEPEAYVGLYHNPGYGDFEIRHKNGMFTGVYRNCEQVMEHYHYDTFKVPDIKEDTIFLTAPLTFHINPYTGDFDRLSITLEPELAPIVFMKK